MNTDKVFSYDMLPMTMMMKSIDKYGNNYASRTRGKYLNYETEYVTRIVKGLDDEEYYMGQKPAGYDEVTIESIEKFDTVALEGDIIADVADSDLGNSEDSQTEIKVGAHQDDQSFYGKVNSFFKGKSR